MDTERFRHFQERISSCFTTLGTGSRRSSWWTTLKSRAHTTTDGPGWLFSTGTRASILSTPRLWALLVYTATHSVLHCCASYAPASVSWVRGWTDTLGTWWTGGSAEREERLAAAAVRDKSAFCLFPSSLTHSWSPLGIPLLFPAWRRGIRAPACRFRSLRRSQLARLRGAKCVRAEGEWWRGGGVSGAAAAP